MQIKDLFEIYLDVGKWMEQFKRYVNFLTNFWGSDYKGPSSTISVISVNSWTTDLLVLF